MEKRTNLIQVEQHILDQAADTLYALDNFANRAGIIADAIVQAYEYQDHSIILRMARMLSEVAEEAINKGGTGLSAEICEMVYEQRRTPANGEGVQS